MEKNHTKKPPATADIDTQFQAVAPSGKQPQRSLEVDFSRFEDALDGSGLSEAEKAEFLHVFWSVILEFIDLGFGIHSSNVIASNACAEASETSAREATARPETERQTETPTKPTSAADESAAEREEA